MYRHEVLESFSNDDGDGKENVKRAIDLLSKTIILRMHQLFCTFPCQRRENAYFHILWRMQTNHDEFFFLSLTFSGTPKKSTPGKNSPTFIFPRSGMNATKFEKMRIYFKSDVTFSLTSPSSMLKLS